jgi:hypothetical protein
MNLSGSCSDAIKIRRQCLIILIFSGHAQYIFDASRFSVALGYGSSVRTHTHKHQTPPTLTKLMFFLEALFICFILSCLNC